MKVTKRFIVFTVIILLAGSIYATPKKFLFDATRYETAGNADWVIDEDNHVAARYPTPLQSTITSSTAETYWTGALSSWGIKLVQLGYQVETLPSGVSLTYGNSSNPQDLMNYDVFIVDEPNSPFTTAEKNAIVNFVQNGGGLFMISDHTNADRNGDGWDAVAVWDDLLKNNTVHSYPFGFKFDSLDITQTTSNIRTSWQSNLLLNGPQGAVSQLAYHDGTTLTLNTSQNSSVQGVIWRTSYSQGTTGVMCATATFGNGRVVAIGDSSPADDGTGSSGHTLYSSWLTEVNGDHAKLHLNASLWLAKVTGVSAVTENPIPVKNSLSQNYPNPFNPTTKIKFDVKQTGFVTLKVYDVLGRELISLVNEELKAGSYEVPFSISQVSSLQASSGVYYYRMNAGDYSEVKKMMFVK